MAYTGSQAQSGRGTSISIGTNLTITGTLAASSTSVTAVSSTVGVFVGQSISGAGIPAGTTIADVGTNTLTLSQEASAAGAAETLTLTPVEIGELSDFPLNRGKWDTVDVTNFESGSDSEFIPTIRKSSTLTLKGNRVSSDAGQKAIEAAYQAGSIEAFTATLPLASTQTTQGDSYTFNAYVISFDFTIAPTKQIEFSIELQVSGKFVETPGS